MLMSLRQSVNKSFVKYIIFGVLILSFGLWGVADLFIPSDGANEVVMTAGDREFTYAEVDQSYRRELRALQLNANTTESAILQQVLDYTLQRLAISAMNAQLIQSLNIQGNQSAVLQTIAANPAFIDGFGRFDPRLFQRFLSISGLTEAEYTDLIAQDIGAQYWLSSLQASIAVPSGLANAYGEYLRQERQIDFVEIPYDTINQDQPSDLELQTYYNSNKENYRVDEERKFTLVDISPTSLAAELTPTEEEIKSRYDEGSYSFEQPEKRSISFIVFDDATSAETAYQAATSGTSLRQVASANGLQVQSLISQAKDEIADEKIAEKAFALTATADIGEVFEGTFGWVLLQLDDITEAETASFDSVRDTITADILTERSTDIIYDKAQALEEAVSVGADLAEAANTTGLELLSRSSFDELSPDIIAEANLLGEGEISTLIERQTPDGSLGGFFMLQLQSIIESHIPEFATVKAQVSNDLLRENRKTALQESLKDLQAFATLWGGEVKQATVGLNQEGTYPRQLNAVEFRRNPVGYKQTFANEESFILAELKSVSLKAPEEGQEDIGMRILQRLMQNIMTQSYEQLLREEYKITRNEQVLRNIISGEGLGG